MESETRFTWKKNKARAENSLRNIERYIKIGNGFNWIPDELSSAIHWAMEGWLYHKGIEPNTGNGWHSIWLQFSECSSKSLVSEASYLLGAAAFLENEMFVIELDEWMNKASNLLSRGKQFILAMQDELDRDEVDKKT